MTLKNSLMLGGCLALAWASAATAQVSPVSSASQGGQNVLSGDSEIGPDNEIVVRAERLRGQLNVEQAPVLELNEADIQAVGANSIADLITAIGPQTSSSRGRGGGPPVFLVNGIRISSFRELRSYPPEAVAKVEVMPEEVAQKFGFPPDRRVVNLILKEDYSSREIELEFEAPDRGGYWRNEQEFTLLTINDGARLNLNLERGEESLLTEIERDIEQTPGSVSDIVGDPDQARFRSLVPKLTEYEATLNWAKAFLESGSSLSFNATYEREERSSLSGLDSVLLTAADGSTALRTFGEDNPLRVRSNSDTFSSAGSWTMPVGRFQMTATADASYSESRNKIDRRADTQPLIDAALAGTLAIDGALPELPDAGFDVADRRTIVSSNKVTLQGSPLLLPAGELTTTVDLGFDWRQIEADDTRTLDDSKLTRRRLEGGASVAIPLTSTREGFLDALGSFTANASLGFEDLSDFGSLMDWTAGLNWSPWSNLDLQATYVWREAAPSLSDLGNPRVETFNVPVFDLVNGETVLATVISGGNPDLLAETQRDWRFSANWDLPFWENTRLSAEYIRNRSRDVTSAFPALSAEVEAAFSDRVTRDAAGTLVALDRRPVTFARTRSERLVFGLTTRGSFGQPATRPGAGERGGARRDGPARPSGQSEGSEGQAPSAERRGPPRNPVASGFGRDGRGRYFFNLTHTIELTNEILIAEGGPQLDVLDGDAQGDFGQARHSSRLEAGIFRDGMGFRLSGSYTGKARINGNLTTGASPLFFDDLLRFDVRVFADIGRLTGTESGFLKGFRISLRADNVFDGQRRVTDQNGDTPLRYQPLLLDPVGRYLGVDFRKVF